jgi:hypothetical protein
MKHILIMFLLTSLTITAHAGNWYGSTELETNENRVTKSGSLGTGLILGYKTGHWQISGRLGTSQAEWGNGLITNTYEGRVMRTFKLGNLKPYVTGLLGQRVSSSQYFAYYALDTGIVIPVYKDIKLDFSYRYRNSFDSVYNFETNRYGVEIKTKISDTDSIGLRYAEIYGDSEINSWRLQYSRNF